MRNREKKPQTTKPASHPLLCPRFNFTSFAVPPPPPLCSAGDTGKCSCSQFIIVPLHHFSSFSHYSLLQHGSLPQATVPHGVLSRGHSFCQEPAPERAFHRLQLPSGHVHLLSCGVLHGLQCEYLLHHCPLHKPQGNICFTTVFPGDCRSTSFPSFFSDPGACRAVSHTFLLTPHCRAVLP